MYDIRQFKPALYVLLVLGITGFSLAASAPGLWIFAIGGILINAWLVKTDRFVPMPRLVANVLTLGSLAYAFLAWRRGESAPILIIGQFLVLLQLVKLFEQRGNRDLSQLLVLSLLLMVAGGISTSSLQFGVIFIVYLFLALYASLLFHLKVETDHAREAIGVPQDKLSPMTLRQDQRFLARSMRRLTLLVSAVSIVLAIVVFLFFPRNTGSGFLAPLQMRTAQVLTGFSDQMNFQQVAQITHNTQIVAWVKLWDNGEAVQGTRPLLLRGATLDIYTGNDPANVAWQWKAAPSALGSEIVYESPEPRNRIPFGEPRASARLLQEISLEPTGTDSLFAIGGVREFELLSAVPSDNKLHFRVVDRTLRLEPSIDRRVTYRVSSSGELDLSAYRNSLARARSWPGRPQSSGRSSREQSSELTESVIDPQIEAYARRPEVSGGDAAGAFASQRQKDQFVTPFDSRIAASIEQHLRGSEFSYTLDLTDAQRIHERDPMVAFLYDLKRGHCEYFAGAMALMCQSLGLQARVVIGFRADEYNDLVNQYVVRQSHAHSWVEVLDENSHWLTFDPTSGNGAEARRADGAWQRFKQFLDYLEFTWAKSVVAYDRDSRANLIQRVDTQLTTVANTNKFTLDRAKDWLTMRQWLDPVFSSKLVSVLIVVLVVALIGFVSWFLYERWKLKRRARRIGLAALPRGAQLRLARQLGFYDDLLRLLARHKIARPANLTPMEFSRTVSFLPHELFEAVRRLTEIFYRIRYGQQELSPVQQRRLRSVIDRIEATLSRP